MKIQIETEPRIAYNANYMQLSRLQSFRLNSISINDKFPFTDILYLGYFNLQTECRQ